MKKLMGLIACVMLLGLSSVFAQSKEVTGTVIDESGFGLPGVSVAIKGTTQGTSTDIDGKWSLAVTSKDVLEISFIGMVTQEITVGDKTVFNVTLKEDRVAVEEVVVVGYGVVKKSELTGSVVSVKSEELAAKPVSSAVQALQGKVAGVQIVSTSGRTGDNTQISIRGNGSLSASNDVLYIIDGVSQSSMGNVTPEDIASMEVLKDAASTAIYGSRASNGVILITTKKGKYNSKSIVSVNSSFGIQDFINEDDLMNASQYKEIHDVARENYLADIAAGRLDNPKDMSSLDPMPVSKDDTDWRALVKRDQSYVQNHSVSITGGSEKTRFYLGGGMFKQEGIIKMDSYEKYRAKLNVDHMYNEYVKFGIQSYFSASESTPMSGDNGMYQPWSASSNAHPNVAPRDENGKLVRYNFVNPLFAFERETSSKWTKLGGSFYVDIKPIENITIHSAYSGNIASKRYKRYDAPHTKRGENGDKEPTGYGYYSTAYNRDYLVENTLTYSDKFFDNDLSFTALAGQSFQEWRYEDSYVKGENFPSDELTWLSSAGEINGGRSYYRAEALESYFSRFQFSWQGKYNMMLSVRADGSSKFTDDNKWGFFPAASAGWNVSNEDFWNKDVVNEFSIRASYGFTGNQSGISYATGQDLIGAGYNYNNQPGLASSSLFNPDLHWEKGESMNFGFNLGLLDDRISIVADYYMKTTKDLLYYISVPRESGFASMLSNVGEISNKGFEINTSFDIVREGDIKWRASANLSYNDNEVVKIGTPNKDYYTTGFCSIVKEGYALGSFYLIEADGIAQKDYQYLRYVDKDGKALAKGVDTDLKGNKLKTVQAGDMIYVDANKDGVINDRDRQVFDGGIAPVFGGFSSTVEYKGFDFTVTGQYSLGKSVYAMYREDALGGGAVGAPSFSDNMIVEGMDYWSLTNTGAANPRPHLATSVSSWNNRRSTRFMEDADYLRITDITLGYNLDCKKISFVNSFRVYIQARNLFTFTEYSGIDPEVQYVDPDSDNNKITAGVDNRGIPNMKSYVIGLNIKF